MTRFIEALRRAGLQSERHAAFAGLQAAIDAYRADTGSRALAFGAVRALVRLCRLHGMSPDHVAMLAELGRVDDEAPARWQLTMTPRKATRPIREREQRERRRAIANKRDVRGYKRFLAVLEALEAGSSLDAAFTKVADQDRAAITAETVRQDWLHHVKPWRSMGKVAFREEGNFVELPGAGRKKK